MGRSLVLGLHRPIDDRFGPVLASRSESLRFNFRTEGEGLAVGASSRQPFAWQRGAAIMGSANSQVCAAIGINAPHTSSELEKDLVTGPIREVSVPFSRWSELEEGPGHGPDPRFLCPSAARLASARR